MKVAIYIEKNNFDEFLKWMNRIKMGIYSTPAVNFSHTAINMQDPLLITLDTREYTLIKDVEEDIKNIQKVYGPFEIDFSPVSTESHLLIIQDVLREAQRKDLLVEVVFSAIQIALQIPDITPSEAIIVAEHEWLGVRENLENE